MAVLPHNQPASVCYGLEKLRPMEVARAQARRSSTEGGLLEAKSVRATASVGASYRHSYVDCYCWKIHERCLGITEGGTTATTVDVQWPTSELRMGMRSMATGICWKCCICLHRRLLGSVDFGERCLFHHRKSRGRREVEEARASLAREVTVVS
ncbi:hypothetical protein B296_00022834 [Ensete ventricosum]|uniref:Uncharacterized protein n=1 Tax=Ensete ventricosum TaxID=4639 RepID=A0A426ZY68_ENSVE|nr:hypothetical protein B296_00022834 [Ensete ventricosum]